VAGGRWNRRGRAVVYTSRTLSLAALEYFVHLAVADAPDDLVAVPADLPDSVSRQEVRLADLPRNWRAYPAPEALADVGTRWVEAGRTAVLIVPSAVIPRERNYLLNPVHPEFKFIRVGAPEPFTFDARIWKPRAGGSPLRHADSRVGRIRRSRWPRLPRECRENVGA